MDEYHELLRRHKLRDTEPRRRVFAVLLQADTPLSVGDVIKHCPQTDRSTIYRALDVLGKIGAIQVVPVGWKQRYEPASLFRAHHHHLHCMRCGTVTDVASAELERLVKEVAARQGFMPHSHTFEISGVCHDCRNGLRAVA